MVFFLPTVKSEQYFVWKRLFWVTPPEGKSCRLLSRLVWIELSQLIIRNCSLGPRPKSRRIARSHPRQAKASSVKPGVGALRRSETMSEVWLALNYDSFYT